jgi:hypothetical protein
MKLGTSSKRFAVSYSDKGLVDETLANFNKQSTQQRGRKREDQSRSQKSKLQSWSQRCLGTNPVPKPPPVARSISERDLMKNMSGSQGADKANPKMGVKLTRGSI